MNRLTSHLFPAPFAAFKTNWSNAWRLTSFKRQAFAIAVVSVFIVTFISDYLNFIESRPGHRISDLLLNILEVRNLSIGIFILLYSSILLSAINLSVSPIQLLKAVQAFCLLTSLRMICLYLIPLEADASMIPLEDPFVGRYFYGDTLITKDLFFSGHVSTMALLMLAIPYRPLKYYLIAATALVAMFLLTQHVHYTIDVFAAPLFSWGSYTLVSKLRVK